MGGCERFRVGIALERRRIAHPWQEWSWHGAAIIPGAPDLAAPRLMRQGEDGAWYHMATLDLEAHRDAAEGYRLNLSQSRPMVYALWRLDPEGWPEVFHATLCPWEAEDYLDAGDAVVEGIPMPEPILRWLADFVARHPVEPVFEKRRQKPLAPVEAGRHG
jgi:hypothetical protein